MSAIARTCGSLAASQPANVATASVTQRQSAGGRRIGFFSKERRCRTLYEPVMDKNRNLREGIEDADATGLVAGEELITQAETELPLLRLRESLPHKDLHAALPEAHAEHATVDALHAELHKPVPNRRSVEQHVTRLRLLPELEAIVVNWWDDPKVQRFFANLGQIGV